MSVTESRYYGLTKVREQGPEAKDWATVDRNYEIISVLLKTLEQHAHTGAAGIKAPGSVWGDTYNYVKNGDVESGLGGWSFTSYGGATFNPATLSSTWANTGTKSVNLTGSLTASAGTSYVQASPNLDIINTAGGVVGNQGYFVSAAIKINAAPANAIVTLGIQWIDSLDALIREDDISHAASGTFTLSNSVVAPATAVRAFLNIMIVSEGTAGAIDVSMDSVMFLNSPTSVGYFDGNTAGAHWIGTAYASASLNPGTNQNSLLPSVLEQSTGGVLTPGASVGVRLSYLNGTGLETAGSGEVVLTLSGATSRPLTPVLVSTAQLAGAVPGGTYVYAITKVKGTGETPVSDVLKVALPYDNTYSVQIQFDSISSYPVTEGVTSLNIYRSSGLASGFQLVTTITNTAATTFTDTNSIPPGNVGIQPPVNNTFDASRSVRIDWSNITHPVGAHTLRVYLTRQAGLWSTDHLLTEVDLTSAPANYITYLGSETLGTGWPLNNSEIVDAPPKVNLGTEATGGLNLTADSNFNGYKANSMVLGGISQSIEGALWYDPTGKVYKGFANSQSVTLSPPRVLRNWIRNPSAETNATDWYQYNSSTATYSSATRDTTNVYSGTASVQATGSVSNNQTLWLNGYTNTLTVAQMQPYAVPTKPGDIIFGRVRVRVNASLGATGFIKMNFYRFGPTSMYGWDGPATPIQILNPTPGTWYDLYGWYTVPDVNGTYAIAGVVAGNNSGATIASLQLNADDFVLTTAVDTTNPIPFFNGDTPGAQWQGTAHASQSISGTFSHAIEEAGGHRAENIWFPTAASGVSVATILSRFTDSASGARIQAQPITRVPGTTSNPTPITSTAPVIIPELAATITPQFSQWIRVYAKLLLTMTLPVGATSATFTMICTTSGATLTNPEYTQTAVISGQTMTITGEWWYQAPSTTPENINIQGYVSAGASAQLVGTNRVLVIQQTF